MRLDCFGDFCLIFAVLILRKEKPSADGCGDLFLETPFQGLLPAGCGAEAVFNFSWETDVDPYGSGDDDDDDDYGDDDDDNGHIFTTPKATTMTTTRTFLSSTTTAANLHTSTSSLLVVARNVSLSPNRTPTRLPPRFTPSLESRHSSFQHLLRLHMNTFNQRLSMLEKNTLDMKESIQRMEEQQKLLSSQLAQLISVRTAEKEKGEKVGELERSYADMETRLHRLEGRLEILIDGFTALAQEMNKMKRARHASRSPPERRELPSLATVRPLPLYPTPGPPLPSASIPFTSKAPVPESIPTPSLAANKVTSTSSPRLGRKRKPATTSTSVQSSTAPPPSSTKQSTYPPSTRSGATFKRTQGRTQSTGTSTPRATVKPEATTKRVLKQSSTKAKGAQKETANTAFQLEPPSHNSKLAKPGQTRRTNSTGPSKGNGRNKAFRSDAPDVKDTEEAVKTSEELHQGNSDQRKTGRGAARGAPRKTNSSARGAITTAQPAKATVAAARKSSTTAGSKSTSSKAEATAARSKSKSSAKRKSVTTKTKQNTRRKVTKKNQQKTSNVMDLLQLLKGEHKSAKQSRNGESSLHVVLGRLAIPIKIIPDF